MQLFETIPVFTPLYISTLERQLESVFIFMLWIPSSPKSSMY
ncbi:hypothetical protein SynBIOSE41_03228 [Synechococcus sp. BIOS-E4-1]|nr:hypothetical protein SynBIOSE41_03228 [Synechococcus sp. BIOS-E4-1]